MDRVGYIPLFVRCLAVFLLVSVCALSARAQTNNAHRVDFDRLVAMVLNYIGENDDLDGIDVELLTDRLADAYDMPIDWNRATELRLDELLFLSDELVESLLYYADVYGPVHSIHELAMVPGIEPPMLRILPDILTVVEPSDSVKWSDAFRYQSHRASVRTDFLAEQRAGFRRPDPAYPGVGMRMLAQYKYAAGDNFRAAVSLESDPGEPWFAKGGTGFDLYRFYAQAGNMPHTDRVVVGSYNASFGQGLLFGSRSYGSRAQTMLSGRTLQSGVAGYAGVSEAPSLFGTAAAASFVLTKTVRLEVTALYSYSMLDADTSGGTWHSVLTSGYHRTSLELSRKHTLGLHTVGADVSVGARSFNVGLTFYGGFFSLPSVNEDALSFQGCRQIGASAHYMVHGHGVRFSGETAVQHTGAVATVNSLHISTTTSMIVMLNHRYISPRYHSFWADAPMVATEFEHGGSVALKVPLAQSTSLMALADVFLPLRATTVTSTSDIGYELSAEVISMPRETLNVKARLRYRVRPRWYRPDGAHLALPSTERVALMQFAANYGVSKQVAMTTGLQANLAHKLPDDADRPAFGVHLYQDVTYLPTSFPFSLRSRVSFNYSPEWANRFYLYEPDVSASGYSPALYGVSFRWYLMAKYTFPFGLSLSARVAQSVYFDRDHISSGRDQIDGNHRTDFNICLAYRIKTKSNR